MSRPDVLITVSGRIPRDLEDQVARGDRPRADYRELSRALGAHLLDQDGARRVTGFSGRLVGRMAGPNAVLALACFRLRRRYQVVLTDGEQVGLPLAVLFRIFGQSRVKHLMVVHVLSAPKKVLLHRLFALGRHIDRYLTYASSQSGFLTDQLGVAPERVTQIPFMVDTDFFRPSSGAACLDRPTICAVGLECRDYPTLLDAVTGLDVRVVIAAASPWSKRSDSTSGRALPANVEVCKLDFVQLRDLYARSAFVVMPLEDVAFQAGVTSLLEAMAMGKAVICSRTRGQTDVVVEAETGTYVAPGEPNALRLAIQGLLQRPDIVEDMGRAARRHAVARYELSAYVDRLADVVNEAVTSDPRYDWCPCTREVPRPTGRR